MYKLLYEACKNADKKEVLTLIEKGANDWNYGLRGACRGGSMELVELMISKGANNWNWGLYGACRGGSMELVQLMISKGANNWNYGLQGACQGGSMELAQLMISKGATNISVRIIYPEDKKKIIKLLELGISREQLKRINKIKQLYNELDEYNKGILKMTEEVIITDIAKIITEYIKI